MRLPALVLYVAFLAACGSAPVVEPAKADPTTEAWYPQVSAELTKLTRDAELALKQGKADQASALITKGQPLINRLLGVPNPTLAAMEAASDLDHLYATMLLSNHHYGWARMLYQKNQARWRNWKPENAESVRRRAQAESGIAACDQIMTK